MFKPLQRMYGIDLGTSNTVICERGKGIVFSEPSVVAIDRRTGELQAAGAEAQAMIGRAPDYVEITYPLVEGVIANFEITGRMLNDFMKKIQGRAPVFGGLQVYISVPCGITSVQRRAVEETAVCKGAQKAIAVEEPLAAAIGAGLKVHEPFGHLVLDIGGGNCQAAILSLGGIVASRTLHRAGIALDRDIMDYVKRSHSLEIGERTAEQIKIQIGTADTQAEDKFIDVRGRDMVNGLPRSIRLHTGDIYPVVNDYILLLIELIRSTIEQCPPELTGDVVEQGILLCGGGALLDGIGERIRSEIGVPVHLADRPLECTAIGTGTLAGGRG